MKLYYFFKWGSSVSYRLLFSLVVLLATFVTHVHAQNTANYAFTTNTTGSLYDMSTGTTQLIAPSLDATSSGVQSIGFNFTFMGTLFTQFSVNDDGVMQLGGTAVGTNIFTITGGTAASPRLAAFNADFRTGTNGKVHMKVIGSAPNRQLVVEFQNMQVFYTSTATAGTSTFQMVLDETTGAIEYIYGAMNASDVSAGNRAPSIGGYVGSAAGSFFSVAYATNTSTTTGTYAANPSVAATGDIANLNSTAQGSRRVYMYVPPVPSAPSNLTFSAVTGTSMTLNWTDNASNELGYYVYRSLDGVTYSLVATLPANTATYNATGLSFSTNYFWKLVAYTEGVMSTGLINNQATPAAVLSGIKTVGSGGDYQNLTTAFADINAQGLSGNVDLQLIAGYPAAPETYPILSSSTAAVGANSVKVYPMVSGLSITSANATGTLNLNNAANITFDGRVNQTGAKDLVISNTNVGTSYAIQLVNDAKNNTFKYCTISSVNSGTSSGTIVFGGTTGTSGNDNNTIDFCDVKDGSATPFNAIYSSGQSTSADNSGNSVTNSNVYNYYNAGGASNGVFLSSNSSAWTINNNKFFQSATRTATGGGQHRAINIVTSGGGSYTINNNVIGYANETGTGVTTYNGGFPSRFFGIELTASTTGTSNIQGNTISGISLTTTSGASSTPGIFAGISILGGNVSVGNTTPNIIGAATGNGAISITSSTGGSAAFGITASSATLAVQNNVIGAINVTGAAAANGISFYGINVNGGSTSTTVSGNTIGGTTANSIAVGTSGTTTGACTLMAIAASNSPTTMTISNNTINNLVNYGASTSSVMNGISSSGTPTTATFNTNTITNLSLALGGSLYGIQAGGPTTLTASNNVINGLSITGASGTIYGMHAATTQFTFNNNQIYNLSIPANSGSSASVVYGIYDLSNPTVENITNNQIYNLSVAGATTSTSNVVMGINLNTTSTSVKNLSGNTIYGLSFANSSTGTATSNGIATSSGATITISKNKIYNISAAGSTSVVNGILIPSGTTANTFNNVIGDLKAPTASGADMVRGIAITSTSTATYRVYYNTIYLNATSSGTNFGTSGIFHAASATAGTATLDLRNNIIINESAANGTGIATAFRRSAANLQNYAATSNRNLFYGGTPSATHTVMYDGTTPYSAVAYLAAVNPRDINSFTGEAFSYSTPGSFFISQTGSSTDYLRPVAGITTQVESGAANITTPAITDDYAGAIRAGNAGYVGTGTNPDLGAYEFVGVSPTPVVTLNSVTPPTTTQCTATARVISVDINPTAGTTASATIGYTVNGVPQTNIVMTNAGGNTWTGTIPVPTPANATIAWGVAAVNSIGATGTYTGTPYSDEPLFGQIPSIVASSTALCSGTSATLTAKVVKPGGTVTLGAATTTTTLTEELTAFCNRRANYKMQTIYTAAELNAAGLYAGPITSIAYTIISNGDATTNAQFTVKIGTTALTALTDFVASGSFTTTFPATTYTHSVGLNTINFSTPFNWNGTSNIVIEITHNGIDNINNAETVYTTTAGNMVAYGYNSPSTGTPSNKRFNIVFGGTTNSTASNVSWSDGSTTIGTTNPISVTPTTTTTYTATITSLGCVYTPAPTTTITVNPLPSAPTTTNSAQCGAQVPTASVASTTGFATPTFHWYSASTGGTLLQNSTSTTYTSVVSVTTTFYVCEVNTTTGCESTRTPVTVNVATPDQIAVVASPTSVCPGQPITLTASNTSGTPFQNYSYSFQSLTTGSGAETPVAGNPVTITPTASGNITYTATGVDGGCAATNTVTVYVKPLPVLNATATPATVCSGDPIALAVTVTDFTNSGTVSIGTQTTTEFGGGVYRNGYGTGDFRHQLIFTAAELSAAGLQPGNVTAINFNVTSVGSGSANNYTIKMGNTAATSATTTFLAAPSTTVYTAATYTAVSGINTHTFSTPFNWDGTSNVLIDICYNISTIGGSSTLAATTPASPMNSNLLGSTGACTATTGTTYANRPLVGFTGPVYGNALATSTIAWTPGGFTTPTASTSVTNNTGSAITQAYTVNVTNSFTGCSNTATTALVTINPSTVAPVANNSTQCGPGNATASVTGSGAPGNTFRWYTVATGGTAIAGQTGNSLSAYNVTATTTFYVSEYNGSCESPRVAVTVTVTPPPAVTIAGSTNLCIGSSEALTASSSNDPNYTYTWSGGLGTGATVTAAPTVNTTYTVTAVDMSGGANNGCNTSAAISIMVNPVPPTVTASASDNTICNGDPVTLTSSVAAPNTVLLNQNFDSGLGTWTTTYSGSAPATTAWTSQVAPYSYSGSMTFTNFATPQGGKFMISNADLGASGQKTRAALISPSFSTVGMSSATLTFQNLYQRYSSGDSAVAVQTSIDGGATWTNLKDYNALGVSQGTTTNSAQVMVNESITLGAGLMNQPNVKIRFFYGSAWGFYWMVDNIQLNGVAAPLTYAWTSSPAGYSSSVLNPPAPVTPAVTTTYTMTATNASGCTSSASTTVTVNQPTTSSTPVTACSSYTWTNGTTYNTSGTYTQTLTNAAGCDSIATLVLTINNPSTSTTTVSACNTYTWTNGTTYNTSGTYTQTLMNAVGCDSVATLVLTINTPTTSSTSITACNSYTWTDGNTYNASGTYTQTLMNANGCDSIATLVLTISTVVTSSTSVTACGSYTWTDGNTYNTSGTYTQTLPSAQGCDSIATLVLTINNPSTSTTTASACNSYTWTDGNTYTASGTYTQTLMNAVGCDSIATLVLTINGPTTSTTAISACNTYTWTDGNTYTASGTYTQTLMNANGCDSIATLVLTINGPTTSTTTMAACDSYTWTDGNTYSASGTYTQTLMNSNGCDSIATLVLTINASPTATATDNGNATITASAGTSYQWINCTTGTAIAGATAQTFAPTANGNYAVVVTNASGCSDTSSCVTINNVSIKEFTDASIQVFPNPTNSDVYVKMTAASATIEVVDAQGKLLQVVTVANGGKVNLSTYETGVYFLRIKTENGSAMERIVKN